MFRKLIDRIEETVSCNFERTNAGDIQRSSFTVGMVEGYIDVIRIMGHKAKSRSYNEGNGCERILYIEIDGVDLVKGGRIDSNGYSKLCF